MWSEVFDRFFDRGWNDHTKLHLLLDFLNRTELPTVEMFEEYLTDVAAEEDSVSDDSGMEVDNWRMK